MNLPQNITVAAKNDFDGIIQLYKQLWKQWDLFDEDTLKKIFHEDLDTARKIYLIAKADEVIVGVCSVKFNDDLHYIYTATLDELIVDNNFRNKGIGKLLLNKVCDYATDKQCYYIELQANMHRTKAHKFYKDNGFTRSSYNFRKELKINSAVS